MVGCVSTNKLLSSDAATLYYSLYSTSKYVDAYNQAFIICKLNKEQTDKALSELQQLDLIEIKTSIRKKKQKV